MCSNKAGRGTARHYHNTFYHYVVQEDIPHMTCVLFELYFIFVTKRTTDQNLFFLSFLCFLKHNTSVFGTCQSCKWELLMVKSLSPPAVSARVDQYSSQHLSNLVRLSGMHTADFHVVGGSLDQKVGSLEKII